MRAKAIDPRKRRLKLSGRLEMRKWRIVGLSFEHAHMGDLLCEVDEHPNAEIAGGMEHRQSEDDRGSSQFLHSQ
jgi:hypothetical protein